MSEIIAHFWSQICSAPWSWFGLCIYSSVLGLYCVCGYHPVFLVQQHFTSHQPAGMFHIKALTAEPQYLCVTTTPHYCILKKPCSKMRFPLCHLMEPLAPLSLSLSVFPAEPWYCARPLFECSSHRGLWETMWSDSVLHQYRQEGVGQVDQGGADWPAQAHVWVSESFGSMHLSILLTPVSALIHSL